MAKNDKQYPEGPVVGIDLGGTNIQIGIVDHKSRILARAKGKTDPDSGMEAVLDRIAKGVRAAAEEAGIEPDRLLALGIGVPGPVDPSTGVVLEAVNLRWTQAPIGALLAERLGLPVVVDNDVNVAVYGEARHGAGVGARHLLGCWVGTGVGGGLILNGELFYGHYLTAGEIGHVLLYPKNPPGSRSIEHNCSRSAIADRLLHLMRTNRKSSLSAMLGDKSARIKSRHIAEAYRKGDELVVEVVDDAADRLGTALGNFTTLLSLQRIILGGGLTEALKEPFVDRVRRAVHRVAFPAVCKKVEVVASRLEDDAGVIGAAMLARERVGARQA